MLLTRFRTAVLLLLATLLAIGGIIVTRHRLAADQPAPKKEPAPSPVKALKAEPTTDDVCAVLGITWWQFDLPKTIGAIELGVREQGQFQRIERYEFSGREAPGLLKVAYQDDGSGEYKLVVLTGDGKLQIPKNKRPADFVKTHGRAVRDGEFFELMQFKNSQDKGWRYALVIRMIDKPEQKPRE